MFEQGDIVEHVATGGLYLITGTPDKVVIEATRAAAYTYRHLTESFVVWVRPKTEMEDGRFVLYKKRPRI